MIMSETELSVICKNCGSEVSPYVTECPYCGARLRKRAPKLERRGDGLEAKLSPRRARRLALLSHRRLSAPGAGRPYATLAVILGSALLLLVQKATGDALSSFGGLIVPYESASGGASWRRLLPTSTSATSSSSPSVWRSLRRLWSVDWEAFQPRLLLLACGSLGALAAGGIANAQGEITVIAGGNGMALGAVAAWFAIRRAESHMRSRRSMT